MLEFLTQNWYLVVAAAASGALLLWPQIKGGAGGGAVDTNEAIRLVNREKAVLVDVCEPAEYAAGHAIGARNVPVAQLDGSKDLPSNKAVPIVLMCATGARSSRAAAKLRKAGHEKVVSLAGGLRAWRDANLPVEKSAA